MQQTELTEQIVFHQYSCSVRNGNPRHMGLISKLKQVITQSTKPHCCICMSTAPFFCMVAWISHTCILIEYRDLR